MTSRPPASLWRRLTGRGWVIAALLGLTLLSTGLSAAVISAASHFRDTLLLLADTTAATNAHSALEWQALQSDTLQDDHWDQVAQSRERLQNLRAQLQAAARREATPPTTWLHDLLAPPYAQEPSLGNAAQELGGYLQATAEELAVLRSGDRAGALKIDSARVDPAAERLNSLIGELREDREREARRTTNLAAGLILLTLLSSLATVSLLDRRLRRSLRQTQRLELERQVERERENRDSLTGLWNRRGLQGLFTRWTAETGLCVLVLDLNSLKVINDSGGHAAGDNRLRSVALALLEVSAPYRLAARWGGDEFVLLLPGLSEQQAHQVAERASDLLELPGDLMPPFAYGVARVSGVTSLERVLAQADANMYEHKEVQRQELARQGATARVGISIEEFTLRLERMETPQQVLGEGLPLAAQVLGFEGTVYLERQDDGFVVQQLGGHLSGEARAQLQGVVYREGEGVTGQAIAHSATRWSNDYPGEAYALESWVEAGLKTVVIVPVRYGAQVMGLIGLLQYSSWRVVTPQVRRLMETVASRLGHAFERLEAVENVRSALQGGLLALGVALEERDLETAGHTERVVNLSEELGLRLGMSEPKLDALRQGASLHDIGKLVIPDAILLKPGPLDASEWEIMRNHATRGYDIAYRLSGLTPSTLSIIRSHHERWDGSGYPDGLAGEAIPLEARIFAVCDVYDALTHTRPYKRAWSHEDAVAEIRKQSGTHFDPQVVEIFTGLVEAQRQDTGTLLVTRPLSCSAD
ncbi:HD domain-containing phosphohydrolase [Deinococcus koreensis]|nr:HD domain-containing phosphohydrolase [Deinococcus koreensis]